MSRIIVLRDLQRTRATGPFGRSRGGFGPQAREAAPVPVIEVEDVSPAERKELLRDPGVVAVTPAIPTRLIEPVETVEASAGEPVWGITAVGADTSPFDGSGTTVSVLDTGIDSSHPAFAGVTIVEQDFSGSGNGDQQGHGTHCAGTIFGRDVDGKRIGVARGVTQAAIGKVLGDDGGGSSEMLFRGIRWAVDQGAQVISMSLGFDFPGLVRRLVDDSWPVELATSAALEAYRGNLRYFDALMEMIAAEEAFGTGVVVVAASGNESRRDENPEFEIAVSLPAAAERVISVGALAQGDGGLSIAPFSNTFPVIAGPGVRIESAQTGGGTSLKSGTSMATPHVAGLAALWWQSARQGSIPANATTVAAKVLATARTDVFVEGTDVSDRGVGLAVAPS